MPSSSDGNTPKTRSTEPPDTDDVDTLKADIEETRSELGATVDELSDRLNVRKQAKAKAHDVQQSVSERPGPALGAAGVAVIAAVAVVVGLVARKRQKNKRNVAAKLRRSLPKPPKRK